MAKKLPHHEKERRFIVLEFQPGSGFPPPLPEGIRIEQGYLDTRLMDNSCRVRIARLPSGGWEASLTTKSGLGIDRMEKDSDLPLYSARELYEICCVHRLEKVRFKPDRFDLDIYKPPLQGLVMIEKELRRVGQKVVKPSFVKEWVEVTDSITNYHLARLATYLRGQTQPIVDIAQELIRRATYKIWRIVFTGAPCTGKSTILEILKAEFGEVLNFLPETATILISQVGIKPGLADPMGAYALQFQRAIYGVQEILEDTSATTTWLQGKRGMIVDRGKKDGGAYSPDQATFDQIARASERLQNECYDSVFCFEHLGPRAFEENRKNNPARTETYEQMLALEGRIHDVWETHPNIHYVTGSLEARVKYVRGELHKLLGTK